MTRKNSKMDGFTVTEMCIAVVLIVFFVLIALFARTNFVSGGPGPVVACISNLRLIDGAKAQWALEHQKQASDIPSGRDIQPYMGRGPNGPLPFCPDDRKKTFESSYSINNVGTVPACKISPAAHNLPSASGPLRAGDER